MKKFLLDIGLAMLITGLMGVLFEWGYGGVHSFPQYTVYLVSATGVYLFICEVISELGGN